MASTPLYPRTGGYPMEYPPHATKSAVPLQNCPVGASLDIFARKWTFMILRDIVYYKLDRFGQFLKNNPGMTPRILSKRLNEMIEEGLLERVEEGGEVRYRLTARGEDTRPILLALFRFGIKYHADEVFEDGKPRELPEVLPQVTPQQVLFLMGYVKPPG
ncbi:MAG TPA: helix-turn-helix domain-containing protein [Candidatus Thermoplasmatota archaeon]|nr:helix-turn-helix domain-containing protein [Candidatus Thermoplasmatota archaeon]